MSNSLAKLKKLADKKTTAKKPIVAKKQNPQFPLVKKIFDIKSNSTDKEFNAKFLTYHEYLHAILNNDTISKSIKRFSQEDRNWFKNYVKTYEKQQILVQNTRYFEPLEPRRSNVQARELVDKFVGFDANDEPIEYSGDTSIDKGIYIPSFQRNITDSVKFKSNLIMAILKGTLASSEITLIKLSFNADALGDGLQRIGTVWQFKNNVFKLSGISGYMLTKRDGKQIKVDLSAFNGLYFSQLPKSYQDWILDYSFTTVTYSNLTPREMDVLFKEINNQGIPLSVGEKRRVLSFYLWRMFKDGDDSVSRSKYWDKLGCVNFVSDSKKQDYALFLDIVAICLNDSPFKLTDDVVNSTIEEFAEKTESEQESIFEHVVKVLQLASHLGKIAIFRPNVIENENGNKIVTMSKTKVNKLWFTGIFSVLSHVVRENLDTTQFIENDSAMVNQSWVIGKVEYNLLALFNDPIFVDYSRNAKRIDLMVDYWDIINECLMNWFIIPSESAKQVETSKQLETDSVKKTENTLEGWADIIMGKNQAQPESTDSKTIVDDSESDQPISCAVCEELLAECTCTKEDAHFTSETEITESTLDESDSETDMGFDATNQEIAEEELAEKEWIEQQCEESTLDDDDLERYDELVIEFKSKNAGINLIRNGDDFSKLRESVANLVHFADFTGAIERIDSSFNENEIIDAIVTWEFQKR